MRNLHTVIVQSMASFFIVCYKKSSDSNTEWEKNQQLERLKLELFSNLQLKLHKPFPFPPFEKSMMAALGLWPIEIEQKEEDGSAFK